MTQRALSGPPRRSAHVGLSSDPLASIDLSPLSWYQLFEALPDGSALLNEHGIITYVNETLLTMTGYQRDELIGADVSKLVPPHLRGVEGETRRERRDNPDLKIIWSDQDLTVLCKDGTELSVDFALSPLELDGRHWMVGQIRDNTARRAEALARADVELRFRVAFESNMAPMSFTDVNDRIIAVNDAFCQMVDFSRDELIGQDSTPFTHPEDVGITEGTLERVLAGEVEQERYVKRYQRKDGRVIDVEVSRSPARDASGEIRYFVFSERDITEERALTAQLSHRALHDPLTGLANRTLFEDRLDQAHTRVQRHGGIGAVLLIDLDDFKGVNDTLGHFAGDELLTTMARRLEGVTRASDTLCRFGGDEFLYLAEGLGTPEEAEAAAERLLRVIAEPCHIAGATIEQHASIGMVVWDSSSADAREIIQNVDAALYEAKRHGRGHHVMFRPSMHQRAVNRFSMVQELHHALESGQLSMHYQPMTDLDSGQVVGFESLMRWRHPERGWIPPSEFIPLAEQSDLILELGAFALHAAIGDAATWPQAATGGAPYVTVNLSSHQFLDPDLVDLITALLCQTRLAPERLVVEITERVALMDVLQTTAVLAQLTRLGVGLALDDFGTGFSSLSHLATLSPRIIKIDQSFVRPAAASARDDALLETIISLGQKLNVTMLAEGIETPGQFQRVRRMGCELGQGYLFSPAVPHHEAGALVGRVYPTVAVD